MLNKIKTICKYLLLMSFILPAYTSSFAESQPLQSDDETIKIPIIMYHKITKNEALLGKFGITPREFEADLKFLEENGYNTIFIEDLAGYIEDETELPEKPIILTFDDGYYTDYKYVYPLLLKYKAKGVMSIIGKPTDTFSAEGRTDIRYPHITWNEICEMTESGYVEIQNHSYDMHGKNGSGKLKGETKAQYKLRIKADIGRTQARIAEVTGKPSRAFTYPLGKITEESYEVLEELGIIAGISCYEGLNNICRGDINCLRTLKRYNRPHNKPLSVILQKAGL